MQKGTTSKRPYDDKHSERAGDEDQAMVDFNTPWKNVFNKYDRDHDGMIPLKEFKYDLMIKTNIRHELPEAALNRILERADRDENGMIDYDEFLAFIHSPEVTPTLRASIQQYAFNYATKLVVPRNRRPKADVVDGRYISEYTCWPPPVTLIAFSILEVAAFVYYAVKLGDVSMSGPIPFDSLFIYNPYKRYEVWRYMTYMFIHAGIIHILFNILIQLALGIPLEMVHKWRVVLIYLAGVIAGSLGTSISDPKVFLAGASGGVYALITGHLATIIMNYREMEFALFQLIGFLLLCVFDFSISVYNRYIAENADKSTGYTAHLAGAMAGLLIGIVALRNLEQLPWERVVWWISFCAFIVFIVGMIIWNCALPSYFLPSH